MLGCWCAAQRNVNIYRDAHMGAILCARESQKCDQLFFPLPISFQPKQPLSCVKSSDTSVSPARAGTECYSLPQKPPFECKSSIHPWPSQAIRSTQLIHKQKCRQNERGVVMLAEVVEKAPSWATNCLPPLHGAARPRGRSRASISSHRDEASPRLALLFLLFCWMRAVFIRRRNRFRFWPAANHNSLSTTNKLQKADIISEVVWAPQLAEQHCIIPLCIRIRENQAPPLAPNALRVMYSESLVPRDNSVIY